MIELAGAAPAHESRQLLPRVEMRAVMRILRVSKNDTILVLAQLDTHTDSLARLSLLPIHANKRARVDSHFNPLAPQSGRLDREG